MPDPKAAEFGLRFEDLEAIPGNPITMLDEWIAREGLPERTVTLRAKSVEPWDRRGIRSMIASNAGKAVWCPRQLAMMALGVEPDEPFEPRALRTWRTGDAEEAFISEDMRAAGVQLDGEQLATEIWDWGLGEMQESYEDYKGDHVDRRGVKMKRDGAITLGGEVLIYSFKTANRREIDRWKEGQPSLGTVAQANLEAYGFGIERVCLVGYAKDAGFLRGLVFRRNRDLLETTAEGYLEAWRAYQEGLNYLPRGFLASPRAGNLDAWQCGYCHSPRTCYSNCTVTTRGQDPHKLRVSDPKAPIPEAEQCRTT